MSKWRAAVVVVTLLALSLTAHAAPTTPDSKRAAQSFALGKSAFARGDFPAAAAAFEQAAVYAPHPATLLNAAEAWELGGNLVRAAELCDRVLATRDIEARYRDVAAEQLARLAGRIGTLDLRLRSAARVTVDDAHEENLASDQKIRVEPGSHTVTAKYATGESRSETVSVAGGETKEVELAPLPTESPPDVKKPEPVRSFPPNERVSGGGPPLGSWLAFGVAAVGAGFATFYGIKTIGAKDDFDTNPTFSTRDDFYSARLVTNVALGVSAAALIAGIVLWVTAPSRTKTQASF